MKDHDSLSIDVYLDQVASSEPTPGGGSVAALTARLAAALGSMVAAISLRSHENEQVSRLAEACAAFRLSFTELGAQDERAFQEVMTAWRLPKDHPQKSERVEAALADAAAVPMRVAQTCLDLLATLDDLVELSSRHCVSDVGAGAYLALAALNASLLNVYINGSLMNCTTTRRAWFKDADTAAQEAKARCDRIISRVMPLIRPT